MKDYISEIIQSLKDKNYGQVVVTKSVKSSYLRWVKIVIVFSLLYIVLALVTAVYQIPQLPKIAKANFPTGEIIIQDGRLASTLEQKTLVQTSDFSLTVDPGAKITDPNSLPFGVFVTSDKLYVKTQDEPYKTFELSKLPNMTLSKESISKWLLANQVKIVLIAIASILIIGALITLVYILIQTIAMAIWASVFYVISRLMKKNLEYKDVFKLVIYASIPWLIIANVVSMTPSPIFYWLNLGLFVYLVFSWITNSIEIDNKKEQTKTTWPKLTTGKSSRKPKN